MCFDVNGEGSIPSPPVFDVFRRNQRGFNPSLVVFDALASAQRRNEEGFSLLVTSIWPTRRGRGWVQPTPFGFNVFRRVWRVFNPSSSSRCERERVQPLIVQFRPGWTRTRRGLIPPHLFSTHFDANGDGVNPFLFFFDVFRRNRGWFNPSSFVFDVFRCERGGHQPSLFAFDVSGCFNTSWHFVFCFLCRARVHYCT